MIHAFFGMVPVVDDAMNAQRAVWAAFKRAFAQRVRYQGMAESTIYKRNMI
jgi:hypothetical protein